MRINVNKWFNVILGALTLIAILFTSNQACSFFKKNNLNKALAIYQQRHINATPDSVLEWLKQGNARFVNGRPKHRYFRDTLERIKVSAPEQRPLAAILSCIDSRVTPELVFDTSLGDLFIARVGANVINEDILGSLEISVQLGAKVIVVLGHTDCGAIKAAYSDMKLGHATQLLKRVKSSIKITNTRLDQDPNLSEIIGNRSVNNRQYIAQISYDNANHSAEQLLVHSAFLREKIQRKEILLVPAIFDVDTGHISFHKPKN